MKIEEVAGLRVAEARDRRKLTQAQLGEHLGALLGKPWSRQVVWSAEHGQRAFTAAELVALARALDTQIEELLLPPSDVTEVELAGGAVISRDDIVLALHHPGVVVQREEGGIEPVSHREQVGLIAAEVVMSLVRQGVLAPGAADQPNGTQP